MKKNIRLLLFCFLATVRPVAAQQGSGTPEEAITALMRAIYSADATAYGAAILPAPGRERLIMGSVRNEEALKTIEEDPAMLQMHPVQDYRYRGVAVEPDATGNLPDGTTARYMVTDGGSPTVFSLVKTPAGWKVDLRWWLGMLDLAEGHVETPGTPEFAARSLTAALVQLERETAASLVMPGSDLDLLFAGAPSQPEPSGHLDALVYEMPLVPIGPGEFAALPSGRVVEGSDREDLRVLVGLMGVVEMPFVVKRVEGEWRVVAEPYFLLLMQ